MAPGDPPRRRSKAEVRKLLAEFGIKPMRQEERQAGISSLTFVARKPKTR